MIYLIAWEEPVFIALYNINMLKMPSRFETAIIVFDTTNEQFAKINFAIECENIGVAFFKRIIERFRFDELPIAAFT